MTLILACWGIVGCDRSETNFDYTDYLRGELGPAFNSYEMINVQPGGILEFLQYDLKDTQSQGVPVQWEWINDTIINQDTFSQLQIADSDLDILLPEKLVLEVFGGGVKRYVKGYRYFLYSMLDLGNREAKKYYAYGVNPHWFTYWWKTPTKVIELNGSKRIQLECGIDSSQQGGSFGKSVRFELVQNIGINTVELLELEYTVGPPDTLKHYLLVRKQ